MKCSALLGTARRAHPNSPERNTAIVLALLGHRLPVWESSAGCAAATLTWTTGAVIVRAETTKTATQRTVFVGAHHVGRAARLPGNLAA
jgi:hypothetical protein